MGRAYVLGAAVVVSLGLWLAGLGWTVALLGIAIAIALVSLYPHKVVSVDPLGKAVFITGCDSGFGNSLARRLYDRGFLVFAGCLSPDSAGALALKSECPDQLHVIQIDVTDEWQVRGALKFVKEKIGDNSLWALVNNAGIAIFTEIEWCSVSQFQRVLDVNVMGVVRVTKVFLPLLRSAKGRVVNVASLAGRYTFPAFAAYSMSKRACIAFSDALRIEMKKFGLKVITIEPALYKTPIAESNLLEQQNRKSWSETPPEVKDAYGDEYFDAFLKNINVQMKRAIPDTTHVIDLMEEAIIDVDPRIRYVATTRLGEIRAAILMLLPTSLTDKLFEKTTPKCLPRQSTGSSVDSSSDNDVTSR
ncbi:short-chain dehydrogenase/reductase family 9C member 7-like isoform X1 [Dreissena polymorpha]|nr:short-chain dehydrogenase/reductase family 9C member 7-like isoform X1 [Dreissena polymorpha]